MRSLGPPRTVVLVDVVDTGQTFGMLVTLLEEWAHRERAECARLHASCGLSE